MEGALAALFGVWFVLSTFGQFQNSWSDRLRRLDRLQLLPIWTFFAPNPGNSDYHIIVRDRRYDGSVGNWRDALPISPVTLLSGVWNPEKRKQKVLVDAVSSIVELLAPQSVRALDAISQERVLMVSSPYLVLLNLVVHCVPHDSNATESQFAVIERRGFGKEAQPTVLFRSPFHGLG